MRRSVTAAMAAFTAFLPPSSRIVRAAPPAPVGTVSSQRYEFGKQSLLDSPHVEHVFRFRNETRVPLRLERMVTSCGCTSGVVSAEKGTARPATGLPVVAPNGEATVRAEIDLAQLQPGQLLESVTLYATGNPQPVARFEMAGFLVPTVSFSPAVLDFHRAEAGQARTAILTAYFDPRAVRSDTAPVLRATLSAVHVQPGGPVDPSGSRTRPAGTPENARPYSYRVSLDADAPLGVLDGALEFVPGAAGANDPERARVELALRSVKVPVVGQVVGAVTAQPLAIVFGKATHAEPGVREITLTAEDAALLKKVEVTADSPWVRGQFVGGQGDDARTRTLRVWLTPSAGAPPGIVRQRLTLRLANGQRMVLPVTGYVPPASPRAK